MKETEESTETNFRALHSGDPFTPVPTKFRQALATGKLTVNEKEVFECLMSQADFKTGMWLGTVAWIERETALNARTIQRALESLAEKGIIRSFHRQGGKGKYQIAIHTYRIRKGPHKGYVLDAHATDDPAKAVLVHVLDIKSYSEARSSPSATACLSPSNDSPVTVTSSSKNSPSPSLQRHVTVTEISDVVEDTRDRTLLKVQELQEEYQEVREVHQEVQERNASRSLRASSHSLTTKIKTKNPRLALTGDGYQINIKDKTGSGSQTVNGQLINAQTFEFAAQLYGLCEQSKGTGTVFTGKEIQGLQDLLTRLSSEEITQAWGRFISRQTGSPSFFPKKFLMEISMVAKVGASKA